MREGLQEALLALRRITAVIAEVHAPTPYACEQGGCPQNALPGAKSCGEHINFWTCIVRGCAEHPCQGAGVRGSRHRTFVTTPAARNSPYPVCASAARMIFISKMAGNSWLLSFHV